jgi:hypothetical protein
MSDDIYPRLSSMDWVRSALANAAIEGLALSDVVEMAEHAKTPQLFDRAVNELVRATSG